jgi:hypothetical protein
VEALQEKFIKLRIYRGIGKGFARIVIEGLKN